MRRHCSAGHSIEMALHVLCLLLAVSLVAGSENYRNEGFIDRLSNGMKFAKDFLGSESVAHKVAEFVVRAFQTANKPSPSPNRRNPYDNHEETSDIGAQENRPNSQVNEAPNIMTPLRHLVRLFGLQPNQISAVAVNALLFVAQMISTFLAGPHRPSKLYRTEDPTTWILNKNSRRLQELITKAKNETLTDTIEELIQEQGSNEETSCIKLLVCKITPFVNRMQKAVFGSDNQTTDSSKDLRGSAIMYRHLPTAEEINDRDHICEQTHTDCNLNDL